MRTLVLAALLLGTQAHAEPTTWASHAPMRALPTPSARPLAAGPAKYVDAARGDDAANGSKAAPWKTVNAAVKRLKPGDTLYLRGGTYFEAVSVALEGTAQAPITIRAMPGELAIIDASIPEFQRAPGKAWEPVAAGEYRSRAPVVAPRARRKAPDDHEGRRIQLAGHFADSMIPLHSYRFAADLRAKNALWNFTDKDVAGDGVYLGPGVWLDDATGRAHIRLAHTAGQPDNYVGETDPGKLPLVIAVMRSALVVDKAAHVRLQDLVFRGAAGRTVELARSHHIELDGVTIYGGTPAIYASATDHIAITRSVVRGTAAPWSSRASMKYRGASPYLLIIDSQGPQSRDWELGYDEFTDGHDGLVIDSVKGLRLHHSGLDNFNDDGIYLTRPPRASLPDGIEIFENQVTRTYTALAFAGEETRTRAGNAPPPPPGNPIGGNVYVYRNLFDLRDGTFAWPAKDAQSTAEFVASRVCSDHGSPTWEPLLFYQNTVVVAGPTYHDYYAAQLVMGTRATQRRILNNLFVHVTGLPGLVTPRADDDLQADGNWLWSLHTPLPDSFADAVAAKHAHDRVGDPRLQRLADTDPLDIRPTTGGVIDAGVAVPAGWPDSLRARDRGRPDIGALPVGAPLLRVGPAAAPPRL